MNVSCSIRRIADIARPRQGLGDIAKAGLGIILCRR